VIHFAIFATVIATVASAFIAWGNAMRAAPGEFIGGSIMGLCWLIAVTFWLVWAVK
jgi:hypothetical protein